jgi:hypothetical protein
LRRVTIKAIAATISNTARGIGRRRRKRIEVGGWSAHPPVSGRVSLLMIAPA